MGRLPLVGLVIGIFAASCSGPRSDFASKGAKPDAGRTAAETAETGVVYENVSPDQTNSVTEDGEVPPKADDVSNETDSEGMSSETED